MLHDEGASAREPYLSGSEGSRRRSKEVYCYVFVGNIHFDFVEQHNEDSNCNMTATSNVGDPEWNKREDAVGIGARTQADDSHFPEVITQPPKHGDLPT